MYVPIVIGVAGALLLLSSPLPAQESQEPETHVFTVTTFNLPFAEIDDYFQQVDKYFSIDKENPHILSEKYLVHAWGEATKTIWIIAEYKDISEIEKAEEWGEKKFEEMFPDSAKRAAANQEFLESLGEGYNSHVDNILVGEVKRMK